MEASISRNLWNGTLSSLPRPTGFFRAADESHAMQGPPNDKRFGGLKMIRLFCTWANAALWAAERWILERWRLGIDEQENGVLFDRHFDIIQRVAISALYCLGVTSPALAYLSGDGHVYNGICNEDGMVLTSEYPVGRFRGIGANTRQVIEIETLYLGTGCDASSEHLGEGSWGWANGGFIIEFPDTSIGFPRQEVHCPEEGPQPDLSQCSQ